MNLLTPIGLLALLLVPVVVLIHLWRIRYRRYTLSSTLLWSRVLSETPLRRPRRLPARYLLLLLQLAALCCGTLALARPSWSASGPHRHLLVAVDTSLLMTATDEQPGRLAHARMLAQSLVDGLAAGDTMTLVDAGTAPRVLASSDDHGVLRQALDELATGYGPSSLADDTPLVAGLAAASGPHTTAYLIAPLGTPRPALDRLRAAVPTLHVYLVGKDSDDRGVANLSISCAGGSCEAYGSVFNTGARPITTRVTAIVDGTEVSQPQVVTLPPRGREPIRLAPLPATVGTIEVRLAGRDPLPADDAAWAVAPPPVRRTVVLVTSDPASPLAQALHAIPNLRLQTMMPDDSSLDDQAAHADLTVLDGTGPDVQPPGNLLLVNPTGDSLLFDALGTSASPLVTAIDRESPLLRAVDLGSLVIYGATRARLPAWAHADIAGDSGPLLFSGVNGGRRIAVLLFDPRPTATVNGSNLGALLAFPTLLHNFVRALAPAPIADVTAGQIATAPLARQGQTLLYLQDGHAQRLPSSGEIAALPALRPGLYSVTGAAGGGAARFAANAPTPYDEHLSLAAQGPVAPAVTTPTPLSPWEGWGLLAVLALFVLGGEWWYYVRKT